MVSFGQLLDESITKAGYSYRGFAKVVKAGNSTISQTVSGVRAPPADDKLADWATALNLSDEKRSEFFDVGRSDRARAKKDSTKYVSGLEKLVEKLRAENRHLRDRLAISADDPAQLQPSPPTPATHEAGRQELEDLIEVLEEKPARRHPKRKQPRHA